MNFIYKLTTFLFLLNTSAFSTSYLPDEMSISDALFIHSHNAHASEVKNWIYAQQLGDLKSQWRSGARSAKVYANWFSPQLIPNTDGSRSFYIKLFCSNFSKSFCISRKILFKFFFG